MTRLSRAALAASLIAVATAAVVTTGAARSTAASPNSVITQIGPFYSAQTAFDSTSGNAVGGEVRYYVAGADTLKIGNAVYLSGDNTVRVSTSGSNHEKAVGIVVGGRSTTMLASVASADVGSVAAVPGRPVIVLRYGRTWVQNDAADTVRAGDRCKPSTNTAGKIMGATAGLTAAVATLDTTHAVRGGAVYGAAVTLTGDGFTKIFCTIVKKTNPSATGLAEINAR